MSESILQQILHEIKDMRAEQQDFKSQMNDLRTELRYLNLN